MEKATKFRKKREKISGDGRRQKASTSHVSPSNISVFQRPHPRSCPTGVLPYALRKMAERVPGETLVDPEVDHRRRVDVEG